jgi:hypothetical protein
LEHLSPAQAASRVPEIERSIAQGGCYSAKTLASTPKGTTRRGGDLGQTEGLLPESSVVERAQSRHDKTGPNWAGFALGYLRGMNAAANPAPGINRLWKQAPYDQN